MPRPEKMLSLSGDLDALLTALPEALVVLDRDCRIARVNAAAEQQYGHTAAESIGRSVWDLCGPGDELFERALIDRVMAGEVFGPDVRQRVRDDGTRLWLSVTGVPIREDEEVVGTCWLTRDITGKRRDQQELAEQVDRFTTAFEASPIGMVLGTFDGRHAMVNPAMCHMLGYTRDEFLAIKAPDFHHPDDFLSTHASVEALRDGQKTTELTRKRLRHKDGHYLWVEETMAVLERDPDSQFHLLVQCRDVSANVGQERRAQFVMDHDHLTGLLNRRAFDAVVEHHWSSVVRRLDASEDQSGSAARGGYGAVVVVDLDGFKHYNDTYGHAMGDHALAAVTRPLVEGLRDGDVAGRVGGDEFVVLLRDSHGHGAELVAERLVRAIADAAPSPTGERRVAASIGIADFDPARSVKQTLEDADRAMYRAKRQGGNRWSR